MDEEHCVELGSRYVRRCTCVILKFSFVHSMGVVFSLQADSTQLSKDVLLDFELNGVSGTGASNTIAFLLSALSLPDVLGEP